MVPSQHNTSSEKKRILVCGATGFIGRNMVENFAQKGHTVTAVSFSRPAYQTPDNVRWVKADLRDQNLVSTLVEGHDIVIQAAATTSGAKDIVTTPYLHVADNAVMNSHLLRACYDHSIDHFIFFSCSIMYKPSKLPVKETDFSHEIEPNYFGAGWTKVYVEKMCEFYGNLGRTKHTIIRHSNIYGPHDKFDLERSHVFGATISKVMTADRSITVWGDGSQARDLLYIGDLVSCVESALEHQEYAVSLYNCGSGTAITVRDLVAKIIAQSKKHVEVQYDTSQPSIPFSLSLDCQKAKTELGWEPMVSLEHGIAKTLDWWRDNIDPITLRVVR